jgi:RNA polymerase subunit RPABC4/transcription elongation factor Spt4
VEWERQMDMQVTNDKTTRFVDEVRIISPVAWAIAALAFVGVPILAIFIRVADKKGPAFYILVPAFLVGAAVMACYILLIGYINRDSGRRGMSRLGWTLVATFIPHGLGIVLYFVLRKPRILNCPQCGATVEPGFDFCPHCRHRLGRVCPHCQRGVNAGDKFCPYCGGEMMAGASAVPAAVPGQN